MKTKIPPLNVIETMFEQVLFSNTNLVSKVSPGSVLKGHSAGIAKLSQRQMANIGVLETHKFPSLGFGSYLDDIAKENGLPTRRGATGSKTYVRVVGTVGTTYTAGSETFTGSNGIVFDIDTTTVIGAAGFAYVPVSSQTTGAETNVGPLTLNSILPSSPSGHSYCINEYRAVGGMDEEDDEVMRQRLQTVSNLFATGTIEKYRQVIMNQFPQVLDVSSAGLNSSAQLKLRIATVNNTDLSASELSQIEDTYLPPYLTPRDADAGVEVVNVTRVPVDIALRADLKSGSDPDEVRVRLQVNMGKLFNPIYWDLDKSRVEWDDLLVVAKQDPSVISVPDQHFVPNSDIVLPKNEYPIVRGFILYDLDGNILSNTSGTLNPSFYPNDPNEVFIETIL